MVELASIHLSVGVHARQRESVQMDGILLNSIEKVVESAWCLRLVERVLSVLVVVAVVPSCRRIPRRLAKIARR